MREWKNYVHYLQKKKGKIKFISLSLGERCPYFTFEK